MELLEGVGEGLAKLTRAGFPLVLVTNQSGIGRGYFSEADFEQVQRRLQRDLEPFGVKLAGVYHCPHAPSDGLGCDCRKPRPGLFLRAAAELGIDLRRSYFLGDRWRDVAPAVELGGTGILIGAQRAEIPTHPPPSVSLADTFAEAVDWLLAHQRSD